MSTKLTVVVNVRTGPFDVYIGRAMRGPWGRRDPRLRHASLYANPYRIGRRWGRNRDQALAEYEALWRRRLAGRSRRLWLGRLRALAGLRLGCWCAPQPCHGDVLVKLIAEWGLTATEPEEARNGG